MAQAPGRPTPPTFWDDLQDFFPFGLAPFIILVLTVVSGAFLAWQTYQRASGGRKADLTMWTFARQHYEAYVKAGPSFQAKHHVKLDLQSVSGDAVTSRLRAAYWAGLDLPDVVEVEISSAGSFFRGPADEILFSDVTDFLTRPDPTDPRRRPLIDRIVKARLSPYTHRGRIYGLPHDVHPVMLAYRADLFAELGIDPNKIETWDDFIREGRRVMVPEKRHILNLEKAGGGCLELLLFQRDGMHGQPAGYFDVNGELILDNINAVETICWYIPLIKGPGRIAASPGMFGQAFAKATLDGYTLASFCPDWKTWGFQSDTPQLAGKMKLMPLPAAVRGGRRTSTWGGTMMGITRTCPNKDLAWAFARHMYMDPQDLGNRFRELNILPPFKDAWANPAFREKRPYWSNQQLGTEYINLADQVPPQYSSPFISLAKSKLASVLASCVADYDSDRPERLEPMVRQRLADAAEDIRRQMKRNPF
jgi:arabinosaccharide transport system substrate-binding protein